MILGLDHIGYGVAVLPAEPWTGFKCLFSAKDLPNPPEKQPLLNAWQPTHSLLLMAKPDHPRVELLAHGCTSTPAYQGIQTNADCITLTCSDIAVEQAFWMRWLKSDRLVSPLGLGARLQWQQGQLKGLPQLDTEGYNSLAFLVSRLPSDANRLLACGGKRASDPFILQVNGQRLHIAFFRSPAGHLLELIQPERSP